MLSLKRRPKQRSLHVFGDSFWTSPLFFSARCYNQNVRVRSFYTASVVGTRSILLFHSNSLVGSSSWNLCKRAC
jgi:hypothetical protein